MVANLLLGNRIRSLLLEWGHEMKQRLRRHDVPGRITAYQMGQIDAIKQDSCNPSRHGIHDDHRRNMYMEGYKQEVNDLLTITNL